METVLLFILKYALKCLFFGAKLQKRGNIANTFNTWVLQKPLYKFHKIFIRNHISNLGVVSWYKE